MKATKHVLNSWTYLIHDFKSKSKWFDQASNPHITLWRLHYFQIEDSGVLLLPIPGSNICALKLLVQYVIVFANTVLRLLSGLGWADLEVEFFPPGRSWTCTSCQNNILIMYQSTPEEEWCVTLWANVQWVIGNEGSRSQLSQHHWIHNHTAQIRRTSVIRKLIKPTWILQVQCCVNRTEVHLV